MKRLEGVLMYLGWWNRPWNLITKTGDSVDVWTYFEEFFTRFNSSGVKMSIELESVELLADEQSEDILEYENRNVYSSPILKKKIGCGVSNVGAYLGDVLIRIDGREVYIEVDDGRITVVADKKEKVFGLYYTVGNSCKIPDGKEHEICMINEEDECCIFFNSSSEGLMCEKFGSTAENALDRIAKNEINAKRIGNCIILGRKEDSGLERKRFESHLGEEVVITVEHVSYGGKIRYVGDKARIYTGYTYGCMGENEKALVFDGDDGQCSIGTDINYFKRSSDLYKDKLLT